MPSPYSPILTGVGLLEGGKLTKAARDKFVEEVTTLLLTGNADGKGGSPSTKIFNSIVPLPPIAGPSIPNVTTLTTEPLFWFGTDPFAALSAAQMKDPKNNPFWHTVFADLLYGGTATALDIPGTTPLFPIFDVSAPFDIDLKLPFALPELAVKLAIPLPKLMIKLGDLGIKLSLPSIPLPPLPPPLPKIDLPVPPLILLDLLIGLIKLPFTLLQKLVLPPDLGLVLDLPGMPKIVFNLALDIVVKLLVDLGMLLTVPKVIIATILIYIKNVVAMVCTDIVGMLVGAGNIAKGIASLTGLV